MRFHHMRAVVIVTALAILTFPVSVFGQGIVTGSISGTVQDSQGAAISGAGIVAKHEGTNSESRTVTNASGFFRLSGLPTGSYTVSIEAPNFARLESKGVVVSSSRDTALGANTLRVGGENVAVTVEGVAPIIETSTSQITNTFSSRAAADLPLMSGSFDRLALLVPGVVSGGDVAFGNTNGADVSVNGQRPRSNNFQIDGQSNNDNSVSGPQYFVNNPDLIGEYQIITNNFSAEYGRNMGTVVNYLTKAGTNAFHGTAFEFYTGNFTDAKINEERSGVFGFCEPGQAVGTVTDFTGPDGCTKAVTPRFVDNRFGGSLGGPIWRDKAWFFGSYVMQRTRQTQSPFTTGAQITPTPAGVAALAAAFPGNPAVAYLQAFGPHALPMGNPQVTGAPQTIIVSNGTTAVPIEFAGVTRSLPNLLNDEQWTVRGDWQLSSKDRLFGRYLREETANTNASGTARGATGGTVDVPALTQQAGIDHSRSWTNNLVSQLRVSYSRADIGFEGGPMNCLRASLTNCPTNINFAAAGANTANLGQTTTFPQGRLVNNTQYQNNNTWVISRHTMKFGGEYDRQRSPSDFLPNVNGSFTFRGGGANSDCAAFAGITPDNTACAFSNFLANRPSAFQLADGNEKLNFKEQDIAVYFQDDWKVKDNLTLNLGLRWEWTQQAINLLHDLTVAQQTGSTPFWDTSLPLDSTTLPKIPEDYNNFGPNVGFAWTPRVMKGIFGEDKTVIRGGFRIAYDPAFYNMFLNVAGAAPVVNLGNIAGLGVAPAMPSASTGAVLVEQGYIGLIPRGSDPGLRNQTRVSEDFHNPYSQQWSLGIQREIVRNVAYEIRYVGNHTVGNFQSLNVNPRVDAIAADFPQVLPAGVTPCTTPGAPGLGRIDCTRALVRARDNTAFSIYHGLQQELRLQSWHGLTAGLAYTWSKAIDNVSEIFSTAGGGVGVSFPQNPFSIGAGERGVSGLSYPHVGSLYWIYDLPLMRNQAGFLGHVVGGWQINGTWRYNSGQAFNPLQTPANSYCDVAFNTAFIGLDACRPILSSQAAALDTVGQCTDSTLADCGLVDFYTGDPVTSAAVHWIYNDDEASLFFGTPFAGVGRNTLKGQPYNQTNLALFKNTKITEGVSFQLQATMSNIFNRQYRGTPDPLIEDGNLANLGSFMNNYFSVLSGGGNPTPVSTRRRLQLGAKIVF